MDILRMALLHDIKLMQLYALGIMINVMEMEASKAKTFKNIYGI